jgi:predicted anti-sigma-YlaC factor YlaD
MSAHLSDEQVSTWVIGRRTLEEQEHCYECLECRAKVAAVQETLSVFRTFVRAQADWRTSIAAPELSGVWRRPPRRRHSPSWWGAVVAATVTMLSRSADGDATGRTDRKDEN